MNRFFTDPQNIKEDYITILGDDVNHISKVLRLRLNDEILVSDGNSNEYLCSIENINKKDVVCKIKSSTRNEREAPLKVVLFQGLPKAQKMDLIIQKCVELGVATIQTVMTSRVIVKPVEITNKLERWNKIAEEAAKQSGRGIIPKVLPPISYEDAIKLSKELDLAVIPYEKEQAKGLKKALRSSAGAKSLGIFIGPEGGFEEIEIETAVDNNIIPVTLGPRILRTETAGFTTMAIALYELSDMGGID